MIVCWWVSVAQPLFAKPLSGPGGLVCPVPAGVGTHLLFVEGSTLCLVQTAGTARPAARQVSKKQLLSEYSGEVTVVMEGLLAALREADQWGCHSCICLCVSEIQRRCGLDETIFRA